MIVHDLTPLKETGKRRKGTLTACTYPSTFVPNDVVNYNKKIFKIPFIFPI